MAVSNRKTAWSIMPATWRLSARNLPAVRSFYPRPRLARNIRQCPPGALSDTPSGGAPRHGRIARYRTGRYARHPPARGTWLVPQISTAMEAAMARGEQALLFLNRRGYAPLTICRACGHRYDCPNCDAWMVEHRFRRQLECHHCGHTRPTPEACDNCGAADELVACGPALSALPRK